METFGEMVLAIVKRIADLHNERIWVADNPESKGSIFWLTLKKTIIRKKPIKRTGIVELIVLNKE